MTMMMMNMSWKVITLWLMEGKELHHLHNQGSEMEE